MIIATGGNQWRGLFHFKSSLAEVKRDRRNLHEGNALLQGTKLWTTMLFTEDLEIYLSNKWYSIIEGEQDSEFSAKICVLSSNAWHSYNGQMILCCKPFMIPGYKNLKIGTSNLFL